MAIFGIDISSYQRGLGIKGTGAKFAIMKATDGTRFVDKTCDRFIQQCKRDGILWGFYHFANSPQKSSMRAQAEYFVNNCKNYFGNGIPCLDWEDSAAQYGGAVVKWGPAYAKQFLDRVYELTGVRPMIYMSASVAQSYDWSSVAKDYGLWGAGYPYGSTYEHPGTSKYNWGAWGSPAIHQYSSSNGLDKNIAYMDENGWRKFATAGKSGGSTVTTQHVDPQPARKSDDEIAAEVIAGKWGNGSERTSRLSAAGYDPSAIQAIVNQKLQPAKKSNDDIASEVIAGKWGNGDDRASRLRAAGYDPSAIQSIVNRRLGASGPAYRTYTVRGGDTLSGIASRYGTTYQRLAQINGISNPNRIYAGQVITIG